MAQPRLIHPVQVTIEVFDQAGMLMDAQAREPIHGARSQSFDTYTIPAQVHIDQFGAPQVGVGGTTTVSMGYILVRAIDMDAILGVGKRPKRGDHITQYTSRAPQMEVVPCDLYITRCDPAAHYPERGATLYKCHFEDRDPVS